MDGIEEVGFTNAVFPANAGNPVAKAVLSRTIIPVLQQGKGV